LQASIHGAALTFDVFAVREHWRDLTRQSVEPTFCPCPSLRW
jgi:hypothetical protein